MYYNVCMVGMDGVVTREVIDEYLRSVPNPSMWGMALDLGYDVDRLGDLAREDKVLRYGLQRIVAMAESRLYSAVYGPLAVIKRVESVLGSGADAADSGDVDLSSWVEAS